MRRYKKAGIIACSNGVLPTGNNAMNRMKTVLTSQGIEMIFSDAVFALDGVKAGSAKQRAQALMDFYENPDIDVIFDVSGGDIANEVLTYLDFDIIANAGGRAGKPKEFWGYSDLSVLLNGIYAMTGNPGVLYQVRNLHHFEKKDSQTGKSEIVREDLFDAQYHFVRGNKMSGIVLGGNARCFLKLAGTPYFPDVTGAILFLEAGAGLEPQIRTYLAQYRQLGVFEKINGVYLGQYSEWDEKLKNPLREDKMSTIEALVQEYVPEHIPIARTHEIGHKPDGKALTIGAMLHLHS